MPDATIDELIAAVEDIRRLKDTLKDYDLLFGTVASRLAVIEQRLAVLETAAKPKRRRPA